MEIVEELLEGCFLLEPKKFIDHRGVFVKTFHENDFRKLGINFTLQEEFYSISHKNVVRGMHFQRPPHEHDKLVMCLHGQVLDVLLDLREGPGYGKVASTIISHDNSCLVFIPKGVAHGFLSLVNDSLMVYKTSSVHSLDSDSGIRWDSFGFDWPVDLAITSERDDCHIPFCNFKTYF